MSMRDILLALALTWNLWLTFDLHYNHKQDKRSQLIDKMTLGAIKIQCRRLDVLENALGIEHKPDTFMDPETLDACEDLMMFGDEKFCKECFPDDPDMGVFDLVAKYGLKDVLDMFVLYKKG